MIEEKNINFVAIILQEYRKKTEVYTEISKTLSKFLEYACIYHKTLKFSALEISPIKEITSKTPEKIEEIPKKTEISMETVKKQIPNKKEPIKSARSTSSQSKVHDSRMAELRKKEIETYLNRKKNVGQKNKLERIMNLKVKKPSVTSAIKDYLNRSSDSQGSMRKMKNECASLNSSRNYANNNSFHEEIKKAQIELKKMEGDKTKMILLYEKKVNFSFKF